MATGTEELAALRRRDAGALKGVVEAHTRTLLNAAYGLGFGDADAEELVQDTFVSFLDALDRFEGRSSVRTFLFGILYRKALERWRKSHREEAVDPVDAVFEKRFRPDGRWAAPPRGPEEEALSGETARLIEDCAMHLPAPQRAAFYLKEVEGEPSESVCNILDVKPTHLRVLLFRARNRLRECLEGKWGSVRP